MEEFLRAKKAREYFMEGYNCSQCLVKAFSDLFDVDESLLLSMASSFGGGMGRMREVCGAVSGMFLVAGALYGYDDPKDYEGKKNHYERIQTLAASFKEEHGSIICRDLLGRKTGKDDSFVPSKRTGEYYKKRPCPDMVESAARILEEYIFSMEDRDV